MSERDLQRLTTSVVDIVHGPILLLALPARLRSFPHCSKTLRLRRSSISSLEPNVFHIALSSRMIASRIAGACRKLSAGTCEQQGQRHSIMSPHEVLPIHQP